MWIYIRIKNREAPFIWVYRIAHPESISRIMWITESKANSVEATKFIDNTNPVITWIISVIPSRNPRFQRKEIARGVGSLIREFLVISISGSLLMMLNFFILL